MPTHHDPAIEELLSFFDFQHLVERTPWLADASRPFQAVALVLVEGNRSASRPKVTELLGFVKQTPGRETAAAVVKLQSIVDTLSFAVEPPTEAMLRLLLEAKDCAVRAVLVLRRAVGG
jgi:hypothetical protein